MDIVNRFRNLHDQGPAIAPQAAIHPVYDSFQHSFGTWRTGRIDARPPKARVYNGWTEKAETFIKARKCTLLSQLWRISHRNKAGIRSRMR